MSTQPKYSPGMVCLATAAVGLAQKVTLPASLVRVIRVSAREPVLTLSVQRWGDSSWDYYVLTKNGQTGWILEDCLLPAATTKEEDQ